MAKLLYPDKFQDINPEEIYREWIEEFQDVEFISGHTYPPEENIWPE
jgi:iron complex transport system substrate-binding protein